MEVPAECEEDVQLALLTQVLQVRNLFHYSLQEFDVGVFVLFYPGY